MPTNGYIPEQANLYRFAEGLHAGNLNLSIQTGFWHDYTREGAHVGTLTLSTRSSGFLLAALVTFIGIVGACFWSLLSFGLHQLRAKRGEEDGLYFQEQVILRNSGSALQAISQFWRVSWAWRNRRTVGRAPRRLRSRFFFLSLPPLLILIGFTTAGIFVGDIIRSGHGVDNLKIDPASCGSLQMEFDLSAPSGELFAVAYPAVNKLNSENMQAAKVYTRECYETTIKSPACGIYPQKSLPFAQANVPCPFGNDSKGNTLCTAGSALNLDTGLLDTNGVLGINAPAKNRALVRLSSTCSPININEFATQRDQSISENSTIWDFDFGQADYPVGYNYTYDTSTARLQVPYRLYTLSDELGWKPLPPLVVSDASTTLLLLESNGMKYDQPVEDPWFSAHIESPSPFRGSSTNLIYQADSPVSAMACIHQYQMCNPATTPLSCTVLGRDEEVSREWEDINLSYHQRLTTYLVLDALRTSTLYWITNGLGMAPLLAQELVNGLRSAGLPGNQWQLEFQTWFKTTLANIQALILAFPVQPKDPDRGLRFSSEDEGLGFRSQLCSSMRIQNTGGYQSFSTLGLTIILAIGIPIILLSLVVEPAVAYLQRRGRIEPQHRHHYHSKAHYVLNNDKNNHREVARIADSLLQLQRQVLASANPGVDWKGKMRTVPVPIGVDSAARFPLPRRVVKAETGLREGAESGEMKYKYDYVYSREDQVAVEGEEGVPMDDLQRRRVDDPPPYHLDELTSRSRPVSEILEGGISRPSTMRGR